MRIIHTQIKPYLNRRIDDVSGDVAKKRYQIILQFDKLKNSGCDDTVACGVLQYSRSTIARWKRTYKENGLRGLNPQSKRPHALRKPEWSKKLELLVYDLRKKYPCWGKLKLHTIVIRDHNITEATVATVGRIITKLIKLKRVPEAAFITGKKQRKKRRKFIKHATRWKYGMRGKKPGEMLQIDHMSVNAPGKTLKHFKAVCPCSKYMIASVYNNASSKTAAEFLEKVINEFPSKIESIQVDGGSEFMKDFEDACAQHGIKLYVLPPRSPKHNGCVERCNGTTRDEFYSQYRYEWNIATVTPYLEQFQQRYNGFRPHQSLGNLTPIAYLKKTFQMEAA